MCLQLIYKAVPLWTALTFLDQWDYIDYTQP